MMAREETEWRLADRIVCGSPFVVEAMTRIGGPSSKCHVIKYPLPSPPPWLKPKLRNTERPIRVLFAGTLQLRKGIQYLWQTAGRLEGEPFEFRAVGPSSLTPAAQSAVGTRIDCRGRVDRQAIWSHYEWADVFVLPTLSEGSANVCWEALSAGARVLATAAAGVTASNAVIVEHGDNAFVEPLMRLVHERETSRSPVLQHRSLSEYGSELLHACR
jgi:glycosyltransferase involved in cell wall biosynthesis